MTIQYIENKGKPQYAVIPVGLYTELVEKAEMLDDIKSFDLSFSKAMSPLNMEFFICLSSRMIY